MGNFRTPIYAYVDETGNTGHNVFDKDQPTFLTAALITKGDVDLTVGPRLLEIAGRVGQNTLHANKLGLHGLERIAGALLDVLNRMDAHFFFSRVEKKYLLCTKLFDSIFDSGENAAVSWASYNLRPLRILLAFKVAAIIDVETAKMFWECLLVPRDERARELLPAICIRLIENVGRLPDARSREVVTQGLEWARDHPEAIQILNDRRAAKEGHFPNMVAFTNLLSGLQHFSELWRRPVARVTHDEQTEFERTFRHYHDIYTKASPEPFEWAGETHVVQMIPDSHFVMSTDEQSPGIQIADVILWLYSQYEKGKGVPPHCGALLNFAMSRAWINDFSFEGVEAAILEKYGAIMFGEISPEQKAKATELLARMEDRRLASMRQYEVDGLPPFMREEQAIEEKVPTDVQ